MPFSQWLSFSFQHFYPLCDCSTARVLLWSYSQSSTHVALHLFYVYDPRGDPDVLNAPTMIRFPPKQSNPHVCWHPPSSIHPLIHPSIHSSPIFHHRSLFAAERKETPDQKPGLQRAEDLGSVSSCPAGTTASEDRHRILKLFPPARDNLAAV